MDIETAKSLVSPEFYDRMDKIMEMCNDAPFAISNHLELVRVTEDSTVLRKEMHPEDLNSNGVAHGGSIYTLMDHTFATAANLRCFGVGQCSNIIYYRPWVGGTLEAEAKLINESKSLIMFEVYARCGGKLIASATFTAFKVEKNL